MLNDFIDFHMHSCYSDGTDTPAELLAIAHQTGLRAVALTDHDTVAGIPEFLRESLRYPDLQAFGGVEISTRFGARELHIVGLFLDPENVELQTFLNHARSERKLRNELIQMKLSRLNYPLTWAEIAPEEVDCASIGRPHFARALMEKYHFPTMQSVFDQLLKQGCPAYVPRNLPEPAAAFSAIHAAGGVAVWAHPVYRERNERSWARRVMKRFSELGLDAVEGYYSLFGPPETALVTELAEKYHLALSGGSDYHGKNSADIKMGSGMGGLRVPQSLLEPLLAKRPHITGAESVVGIVDP